LKTNKKQILRFAQVSAACQGMTGQMASPNANVKEQSRQIIENTEQVPRIEEKQTQFRTQSRRQGSS